MSVSGSPPIKIGLLEVQLEERPDRLIAHWFGRSEARDTSKEVDPLLKRLLERAEQERRTLELHFERLEHFNSATVGALLRMINSARERAVKVELCYEPGQRWQAISFEALSAAVRAPGAQSAATIRIRAVERAVV